MAFFSHRLSCHPSIFTALASFCHYTARYGALCVKITSTVLGANKAVYSHIRDSLVSVNDGGLAGKVWLPG